MLKNEIKFNNTLIKKDYIAFKLHKSAIRLIKFLKTNILILFFIIFSLFKFFISLFIQTPFIYDEFAYIDQARFFALHRSNLGEFISKYPPFYPLILSFAYLINFSNLFSLGELISYQFSIYMAIKLINSCLSSLIIFPLYKISKRYFSENRSIIIGIFSSFMPSIFGYAFTIMSENIFYLLFYYFIYFNLKSVEDKSVKDLALASFLFIFCLLTRSFSYFLIPIMIFTTLNLKDIFFQYLQKQKYLALVSSFIGIIISIIAIMVFIQYGSSSYESEIRGFLNLPLIYSTQIYSVLKVSFAIISYIIVSSGILGFLGLIYMLGLKISRTISQNPYNPQWKHFIILFLLVIGTFVVGTLIHILIASSSMDDIKRWNYLKNAILGRYLSPLFPMFLILGSFLFNEGKRKSEVDESYNPINFDSWKLLLFSSVILSFFLLFIPLPIYRVSDNLEFSLFNGILYFFPVFHDLIKILIIVSPFLSALILSSLKSKVHFLQKLPSINVLITFMLIFFILSSFASFLIIQHRSDEENNFHKIGKWLSSNNVKNSTIWMDDRDYIPEWRRDSDRAYVLVHVALGIEFWSENRICKYNSSTILSKQVHYFVSLYSNFSNTILPFNSEVIFNVTIDQNILEGVRSELVNEESITIFLFSYNSYNTSHFR